MTVLQLEELSLESINGLKENYKFNTVEATDNTVKELLTLGLEGVSTYYIKEELLDEDVNFYYIDNSNLRPEDVELVVSIKFNKNSEK